MNVWRLIAHHEHPEKAIIWSQRRSRIAIGWNAVGDLRLAAPADAAAIALMIREAYPDHHNAVSGGASLWHFYREMAIGDLVILGDGKQRRAVYRITGDYEWIDKPDPDFPQSYFHQRSIRTTPDDPNELWDRCGARPASGESIRWTLVRCGPPA